MPTARRRAAVFAILFALATSTAAAQPATGDMQGTVTNGFAAVLADVTVTITNTATGAQRETVTDGAGFFAATGLPPGSYEVQASARGFATQRQPAVLVRAGQVITLRLELGVARDPETITVASAPPMAELTRSQLSTAISSTEVEHLPLRDRNTVDLALLAPAVSFDPATGGPVVAGQRGAFNRVIVDGVERSQPFGGTYWTSQEAALGVQVSTSAYTAEYGRTTGGIIEVVTRSGSNALAGSAFDFHGDSAENGTTNQFGGSLGGPIVRNRHFAYGTYDGARATGEDSRLLNRHADRDLLLAKTDHQLSDAHRLALRYESSHWSDILRRTGTIDASAHAFTATAASALGRAVSNEARFDVGRNREGDDILTGLTLTRVQFGDTLTWLRGAHKVKTGIDAQLDRVTSTAFGIGRDAAWPDVGEYSLFAQDEWRVAADVTLNLGIRYDAHTLSQPPTDAAAVPAFDASAAKSDYSNFGPRLGAAWTPMGSRLVVRGGYAVVYGRTPWLAVAAPFVAEGIGTLRSTLVAFDADYRSPRVRQASGGFEWEWMPNASLSVNYLMLRGDGLPRAGASSLVPGGGGPFLRVVTFESTARSRYNALTAELTRRFAQGHQYRLSYTLGRMTPMTAGLTASASERTDSHHRFAASAVYTSNRYVERFDGFMRSLVKDWTVSVVYNAQTGLPFTAAVRLPAWYSIDPRVARDLKLRGNARITLLWQAFNFFNEPNPILVNDALFGPLVERLDSRAMQLAARFSF